MTLEIPENISKEKPSEKIWKIITILVFVLLGVLILLFGFNAISNSTQENIYIPEDVVQVEEEMPTFKPVHLSKNDKVLLVLGLMLIVVVGLDRQWQGESKDTVATIIGICIMLFGENINLLSENSLAVIVASMLIVYLVAFLGKLDFSAPGGYWGILAIAGAVFGNFGALQTYFKVNTSSLFSIQEVTSLVLTKNYQTASFSLWIYSMITLSAIHFLLELLGLRLRLIREKSTVGSALQWNVRWVGLGIALVMMVIPFVLTRYAEADLWLALLAAIGVSTLLVALKQKFIVGARTNEESFSSAAVGRVMLQSQWDGIALGITLNAYIILLTSLYG